MRLFDAPRFRDLVLPITLLVLVSGSIAFARPRGRTGSQSAPAPVTKGQLGIFGEPYRNGNSRGVRVVEDTMRRPLYRTTDGQKGQFRQGHDIILEVNGVPVGTPREIQNATFPGKNTLRIYDAHANTVGTYTVNIPQGLP